MTPQFAQSIRSAVEQGWGQGQTIAIGAPSRAGDPEFVEWWRRAERMSASPQGMSNVIDTISRTDVRDVLGSVQAPTLVLHRRGDRIVSGPVARELAESLPHARFVELPGDLSYYLIGDVDPLVEEVQEFLTGTRGSPRSDRILATLLFSDIVGSTAHASALGDSRWRELIARHDAAAARQLARFGGHQLKHTGDGLLAQLGLRPVAARGTSPPSGRAGLWQALPLKGKRKWPSPGGGRGNHSLSYQRKSANPRRDDGCDRERGLPVARQGGNARRL